MTISFLHPQAGNILVDKDGAVKLADFGVAATMERGASWGHDKMSRMTFVGTPWCVPVTALPCMTA